MRILIVGSDANAYTLAKKMSGLKQVDLVFVAPGNENIKEFATSIDIHDSNVDELLDFAKANEINLTIVTSETAILKSIANIFTKENLNIFAPTSEAARIALSKASSKKTLYKLRIQTPKFGIFDRENLAIEYARNSKYPLVVKNDIYSEGEKPTFCNSFSKAKLAIEKLFEDFSRKILIEDYVQAKEVSFYVITDGYTAFPIGRVCSKKHYDGHYYENQKGVNLSYSPDYYISDEIESRIMSRVVYPIVDEISKHSSPYVGILGIDLLLTGNNFQVLEFNTFFNSVDMQSALPLIKNDLYDLLFAATFGSLSDEYTKIDFENVSSVSLEMKNSENIKEDPDELITISYSAGNKIVLTSTGATLSSAKNNLQDYLESLDLKEEELSSDALKICEGILCDE